MNEVRGYGTTVSERAVLCWELRHVARTPDATLVPSIIAPMYKTCIRGRPWACPGGVTVPRVFAHQAMALESRPEATCCRDRTSHSTEDTTVRPR